MSKVFTPAELAPYDGVQKEQIYFSVRGKVYDVTDGKSFYGPGVCPIGSCCQFAGNHVAMGVAICCMMYSGSGYHIFAGKECSAALGKMSLKEEDVHGNLEGLDEKQMETLSGWQQKFDEKYPFVGRLEG